MSPSSSVSPSESPSPSAGPGVYTYYFDGSDVAATDNGTDWANVTNADDGSISTNASTNKGSAGPTSVLVIQGTNAPSGDGSAISQVRVRVYGNGNIDSPFNNILVTDIYDDTQANLLGTVTNTNTTAAWSSYITLSAPPGGWDWTKVQALESLSVGADMGSGSIEVNLYKVEIEVTTISIGSASLSPSSSASPSLSPSTSLSPSASISPSSSESASVSPSICVSEIKTVNSLDRALIQTVNGLPAASINKMNGLIWNC